MATMDITANLLTEQIAMNQPFEGGEADGAYLRNRERLGKQRKKFLNENPEHKNEALSGMGDICDGTNVHKVHVNKGTMGRGDGAKKGNVLVTADETLQTVTIASGKSAERTC